MMCQTVKNNTFVVFRLGGEDLIIQCLKQRVTPTQKNTADKLIILPLILSSNLKPVCCNNQTESIVRNFNVQSRLWRNKCCD